VACATDQFRSQRSFRHTGSPGWSLNVLGVGADAAHAALRRERVVPEGENRDRALERVAILDCARKGENLSSCDPAADPLDVKVWKKIIEAAGVDQGAYAKALAAILGDLVCSNDPDRTYVLCGILRFGLAGEVRLFQIAAEMPALAKRITSPECPVSTALTDADKTTIVAEAKTAVS
jgi:hypothetical protein